MPLITSELVIEREIVKLRGPTIGVFIFECRERLESGVAKRTHAVPYLCHLVQIFGLLGKGGPQTIGLNQNALHNPYLPGKRFARSRDIRVRE